VAAGLPHHLEDGLDDFGKAEDGLRTRQPLRAGDHTLNRVRTGERFALSHDGYVSVS
jgi:hypothetical protein